MKHLNFILISTFIAGFLTGVYVFFMSRSLEAPQLVEPSSRNGFEIIADSYGGCELVGCASYRILENGSYTYIQSRREGEAEKFEDIVSKNRISLLKELLHEENFTKIEESEFSGTCPITYDGLAYKFTITYEGKRYKIDTCIHDTLSSQAISEFRDYFEIFALTHGD
jgi:hypothetical protein